MSAVLPVCVKCNKTESVSWVHGDDGSVTCNDCIGGAASNVKEDNHVMIRSTRAGSAEPHPSNSSEVEKGRRAIFKKTRLLAPRKVTTYVDRQSIFHEGQWFTVGDIVRVRSTENATYYCQLRRLLIDQNGYEGAMITWLFPTKLSPPPEKGFDPASYIKGTDDDIPRSFDYFKFVMSASSDYYDPKNTPRLS